MEYKLILDQQLIDEYADFYFKEHPRAKKKPIERPIMPTLNQILILQRPQIAALKAKYKEFGIWLVHHYGYEDLALQKFELEVRVYMPTKRRFDLDNCVGGVKLLIDAFTETQMIVDDNSSNLIKLTIMGGYDKDNPRTEYILRTVVDQMQNK